MGMLSTNGLGLDSDWLDMLSAYPKGILTLSLDGTAEQNRRFRRPAEEGVGDAYDHIRSLLPQLLKTPRVVVTQTICPLQRRMQPRILSIYCPSVFGDSTFYPGTICHGNPSSYRRCTKTSTRWRNGWNNDGTPISRCTFEICSHGHLHPSLIPE